jgi:hypothetical protein
MGKKLSQQKIEQIIKLHNSGRVSRDIAKTLGISKTVAQKYISLHKAEIEGFEQAEEDCAAELAETPSPIEPIAAPYETPSTELSWLKGSVLFIGWLIMIGILIFLGK